MKIAIGHKIQDGPWGGGNNFSKVLVKFLLEAGHEVYFDLSEKDLDIILITDPRPRNPAINFKVRDVYNYKILRNRNVKIFHRINECDERKGTKFINYRLRNANAIADHSIFIASWLKTLDVWTRKNPATVILNGGDADIFNAKGKKKYKSGDKLKIVTHHWGANKNKGFDIYKHFDLLLNSTSWSSRFEFTFVGNLPRDFKFENIKCISPKSGQRLGDELRKHDIYLTASINEPAGMHHIEGALCGLPLLYRNSGALPEYCSEFGISFDEENDFEEKLVKLSNNFEKYQSRMKFYDRIGAKMAADYEHLFLKTISSAPEDEVFSINYDLIKGWLISYLLFI